MAAKGAGSKSPTRRGKSLRVTHRNEAADGGREGLACWDQATEVFYMLIHQSTRRGGEHKSTEMGGALGVVGRGIGGT